jgi:hypothetical protein
MRRRGVHNAVDGYDVDPVDDDISGCGALSIYCENPQRFLALGCE